MEKNNEGLRVMFNEVLHGNTKLQKDKKEQEVKYTELQSKLHEKDQEMQCKLQLMERKTEGLQVMFDEVLQRNAQLQKNNKQLEVMQREMKHVLQDFQKKNTELRVLYNDVKDKKN